jgi:hypothetical protein
MVNTGRMLGAAYMAGHKQATTTNKYSHADEEQALELMGLVDDSGADSGIANRTPVSGTCAASAKPLVFSCAKGEGRTHTGVTPLAPQGSDNAEDRSVSRRLLCATTRGDAQGIGHSGIKPQYSDGLLALVKAAFETGVLPGQTMGRLGTIDLATRRGNGDPDVG